MSIFKTKLLDKLQQIGISNPKKFLEESACDEEGSIQLDLATKAFEKIISAPPKIKMDVEGFK